MTDTNPMPDFLNADFVDADVSARSEARDSLFLTAVVEAADWPEPVKVRVRNLSAGGMLVESDCDLQVGKAVRVILANIRPVMAHSVWVGDGRFGVAFDKPIDPQMVRRKILTNHDLPPTLLDMTLHTTKFKKPLRPV